MDALAAVSVARGGRRCRGGDGKHRRVARLCVAHVAQDLRNCGKAFMISIPCCPKCDHMAVGASGRVYQSPDGFGTEFAWLCGNKKCESYHRDIDPKWVQVEEAPTGLFGRMLGGTR